MTEPTEGGKGGLMCHGSDRIFYFHDVSHVDIIGFDVSHLDIASLWPASEADHGGQWTPP